MGMVIVRAWAALASDGLLIAASRIANQKISDPKIFRMQSMPPRCAWSSFGRWPILQAMGFNSNAQKRHSQIFGSENFGKAIHAAAMRMVIVRNWDPLASDWFP